MTPRLQATLVDLLDERAQAEPEHVCLRSGHRALSCRQWAEQSWATGHALIAAGVVPGLPVLLVYDERQWLEYAVAALGALSVGAVIVPVSRRQPAPKLAAVAADCDAKLVLADGAPPDGLGHLRAPDLRQALSDPATPAHRPDQHRPVPADPAQILFTSGTTGGHKAVAASHANLAYGAAGTGRRRPLGHSRYFLHAYPIGSNAAQTMLVNALTAAATGLTVPRFDPAEFCSMIEQNQVGTVFLVPATAAELIAAPQLSSTDVSSVVLLGSTAAALPAAVGSALAKAFPAATIVNYYSSTEAAPAQTMMILDEDRPGSLGRPASGQDVRITDQQGLPVGPGAAGQVWLRSPTTARHYLGEPASDEPTFVAGWIRTGDVGLLDQEGYLYLLDRESDLVKVGGQRVSTIAVESALHEHPQVLDACVVGLRHERLGQTLAAAVITTGGLSVADLRRFLVTRLAVEEVPTRIRLVDELPRNDLGKVLKTEVRQVLSQDGDRPGFVGPSTPAAKSLAGLWQEVLGVQDVGLQDDFFLLGGDSLSVARLADLTRRRLNLTMPPALAYSAPLLQDQVAWLESSTGQQTSGQHSSGQHSSGQAGSALSPLPAPAVGEAPGQSAAPQLTALQEYFVRWMYETPEPRAVSGISVAIALAEPVDADLLQQAVLAVVGRHEGLRTTFPRDQGVTHPSISPEATADFAATAVSRDAEALALACRDAELPFDVDSGPLVRARLYTVEKAQHLLLLCVHHLVVDGWSMGLVLHDLGLAYSALRAGREPLRRPLDLPLTTLTHRMSLEWVPNRQFWDESLAGAPAGFTDFPGRSTANEFRGRSLPLRLAAADAAVLRGVAATLQVTPSMLVAACWSALLSIRAGQSDLVLMCPVSGRLAAEHDRVVGCLVQSLLIRLTVRPEATLRELTQQVRAAATAATSRQHYRYEQYSRAIPYPAWIRFEHWAAPAHLPGIESRATALPRELAFAWPLKPGETDLGVPELALTEQPDGALDGALVYNEAAFAVPVIQQLAVDFKALCRGARLALDEPLAHFIPPG